MAMTCLEEEHCEESLGRDLVPRSLAQGMTGAGLLMTSLKRRGKGMADKRTAAETIIEGTWQARDTKEGTVEKAAPIGDIATARAPRLPPRHPAKLHRHWRRRR
mmetsp:Transcript_125915/g.217327  ORF Transcript_125915/g.217327 Transcript_125915/m.217327 type:complete len:104 (+) Transcript_125915:339-650(+)